MVFLRKTTGFKHSRGVSVTMIHVSFENDKAKNMSNVGALVHRKETRVPLWFTSVVWRKAQISCYVRCTVVLKPRRLLSYVGDCVCAGVRLQE